MREIKFRIWDKKNKRWFHGSTEPNRIQNGTDAIALFGEIITLGEILRDQNDDSFIRLKRMNDLVPLQFTGLKDDNGREIYEGDIVTYCYPAVSDVVKRSQVFWSRCSWAIGRTDDVNMQHNIWGYNKVVIGNIYENPELLK